MEEKLQQLFYIGDYTTIAQGVAPKDEEGQFIFYRSHIHMGSADFVISKVKNSSKPMFIGLKLLALASKSKTTKEIDELIPQDDSDLLSDSYYSLCKASIYSQAGQISEALETLLGVEHPEASALRIHCYLELNRSDLAQVELQKMTEGSVLAIIWKAFINLRGSREEIQESLFNLQDLMEGYTATPLLQNAIACCHYALDGWDNGTSEIESFLTKFPNDKAGQINKAVGLAHQEDYDAFCQQVALLRSQKSNYNDKLNELLKDFDTTASRLSSE